MPARVGDTAGPLKWQIAECAHYLSKDDNFSCADPAKLPVSQVVKVLSEPGQRLFIYPGNPEIGELPN